MKSCEFVTAVTIIACQIAKDKTEEEIEILSAVFTQLRRYLSNDTNMRRYKIDMKILRHIKIVL